MLAIVRSLPLVVVGIPEASRRLRTRSENSALRVKLAVPTRQRSAALRAKLCVKNMRARRLFAPYVCDTFGRAADALRCARGPGVARQRRERVADDL